MTNLRKAPRPVDVHVGARVRGRRMVLGMSQTKLADALGITFQQVQKYEKGANRIGASRLHQMAVALKVPPGWFFDGLDHEVQPGPDVATELMRTPMGASLARAFMRITDVDVRRSILNVAEVAAEADARRRSDTKVVAA